MPIVVAVVLLIGLSAPAHAYIDPGSGSYILQIALTGVLALVFSLKSYWQRVKAAAVKVLGSSSRSQTRL